MMKKALAILSLFTLLLTSNSSLVQAADTKGDVQDNQIIDVIKEENTKVNLDNIKQLDKDVKFKTFNSCGDMNKTLSDYFKKFKTKQYPFPVLYGGVMMKAVDDAAPMADTAAGNAVGVVTESVAGSSTQAVDYSTTNVQVKGVDEPEIIKSNGKNLFYYNKKLQKVYILDIDNKEILKEINVPSSFNQDTKLFLDGDSLVMASTRYIQVTDYNTLVDKSQKTTVIIYDISDIMKPKLVKLFDINGSMSDSRMVGDKLYMISKLYIRPYYDYVYDSLLPKALDVEYTTDKSKQNVSSKGKKLPYNVSVDKLGCDDVFYALPTDESMEKYNIQPTMSIVSEIDIKNYDKDVKSSALFGDVAQIHMSNSSLYVANNFYTQSDFRCGPFMYCFMPYYRSGENTLIHKFTLGDKISYVNSTIIPGLPINQYSMDEDSQGYFRIITNDWYPNLNTNLYILDSNLKLYSSLADIQPGEQFKSSRFMGDKLYLVTFQQIDPLFVIDLKDKSKPKIVGELKIPGYSTYLHPYADSKDGIQYIIGLGYDTKTNQWGGVTNAGLKIDLYKIDYNNIGNVEGLTGNDYIDIKQVQSKIIGDKGSWSEALENPRMFVWNEKSKTLLLPTLLQTEYSTQNCNIQYDRDGKELYKNCYPMSSFDTNFAGIKGYSIDPDKGIGEVLSRDYKDKLITSENKQYYGQWNFSDMNFRVGYVGDLVYDISSDFANFGKLGDDSSLSTIKFGK